jgi:23S rRNA (cytidine2498-2'-O)-methyltransferase
LKQSSFLAYCRPGYEKDMAAELMARAAELGISGYCKVKDDLGFCTFETSHAHEMLESVRGEPLIFARQLLYDVVMLEALPANDRITPILSSLTQNDQLKHDLPFWIEHPDTNEGRQLAAFCKKFSGAFSHKKSALKLVKRKYQSKRLHICFLDYETCFVGFSDIDPERKSWPMGIARLKFPKDAPSRSTLKLDEAFLLLVDPENDGIDIGSGGTAVDLGAAPGGWTYQLVQREFFVTAVDHAKMDSSLLSSGMVEHAEADAFHYFPKSKVNLLVCDMVEKPSLIVPLIVKWFELGLCDTAIFNLKLPMKQRFQAISKAIAQLEAIHPKILRCRHLYHNRDELTLYVKL